MPALSALCSGMDSNCRDSKDEARCSFLRALCALAVLGQRDFSGSESWTGMQQKVGVCWNNSSFASLVYFVWMRLLSPVLKKHRDKSALLGDASFKVCRVSGCTEHILGL